MSIALDNLDIIKQYPEIYNTSNEKHVLGKDFEKILATPEYKILGFLNGCMFCSYGNYIARNTLDGVEISRVLLECDHAAFFEGKNFFYTWHKNTVTKIDINLNIIWDKTFEDNIESITTDVYGSFYVIYETSRTIRKFSENGDDILFITESDDVTKKCKLYKVFVTPGGGFIYVIGSQFYGYNDAVDSFIDTYDIRKGIRTNRQIFAHATNVKAYDELYEYDNIILKGDYFYIYAKEYIMKINLRGRAMWRYTVAYNSITQQFDEIGHIEYDDNAFEEYIYFCEDLYSSNGHGFGKLTTNGKLLWKFTLEESVDNANFKMCIYQNKIYTSDRANVQDKKSYVLALNNNNILFRTQNGRLVKIIEYNKELYSSNNFEGFGLIGRQIKEGIEKTVVAPLKHDRGNIITSDGKALLLNMANPNYTSEDNYDYFNLLHSMYTNEAKNLTIVGTQTGKVLRTKMGSILKTKQAYSGETVSEYLTTSGDQRLLTSDDQYIVRNQSKYVRLKYLYGDRNLFKDYIISKIEGLRLTTKRDGYNIIRKVRQIYRYILSKYNDIDIVAEWLIQNNVLDTLLPEYVDKLRHHTTSMIQTMQMAGVPILYDIQSTKKFEYTFNNFTYTNQTYGNQIFVCNNLPFNKRSDKSEGIYIDSIANLVEEKKMRPFLLFLNGRAIKWSDCVIVRDWSYTYVVIKNTNVDETNLECILFPCNIRYGEDSDILDSSTNIEHLYFNADGILTENQDDIAFRIETIDGNINGDTQSNKDKIIVPAEYNQLASEKNILVFENGKLFSDSRFYMTDYGKNIFTYDTSERDVQDISFKTFYYVKANEYLGNLLKVPNQGEIRDQISNRVDTNGVEEITADNFMTPFNFKLYRTKSYEQNIAEAVAYIMSYDMSLLVQYYKQKSNIRSYIYTAEDIINRVADTGGYLYLPRNKRNNLDDFVMVFVDNELYEFNHEIQYLGKEFKIPVFDHIERGSIVEVLHFCNVNNDSYTLTIDEGKDDYLAETLRYDNFALFGHSVSGSQYYADEVDTEYTGILYDIDFSYKNNFSENGRYKSTSLELSDSYYYGKKVTIASKRQFRYMYYTMRNDMDKFDLSPDFRFCHNKNQFMVFLNKKKINFSDFDLHIVDYESDLQWNYITTNIDLVEGDRLEIFYLPDTYEEITVDNIGSKGYGDIYVDTEDIKYTFDKDLFLIFLDGQKINYNSIENVSANRVRVKNESGILENVTVVKLLQEDKLLSELYSYSDSWSKAIDSLQPKEYEKLLLQAIKK